MEPIPPLPLHREIAFGNHSSKFCGHFPTMNLRCSFQEIEGEFQNSKQWGF